jgi:F420H(2)-dependent quinone reductase
VPVLDLPGAAPALIASNAGAKTRPTSYRNLPANPLATISTVRSSVAVTARVLVGERDRVCRQAVVRYPAHASHQRRAMPEIRS